MFLKFFLMLSFIYSFSYADTFLDKERLQASKEKKLILLSISSEHCPYCIKMKKNIFDNVAYIQKITQSYVHVTIMNDETMDLCKEIVRCNALDRVHIGLDYFDASINRIGAYVVGSRATQKCVLQALLEPLDTLRKYEANDQLFERLALLEEGKSLPWNAVWDMFCLKNGVPVGEEFITEIQKYEADVTSKRN